MVLLLVATGCGAGFNTHNPIGFSGNYVDSEAQQLKGDVAPIRDPSMIYANGTYYVFSTDTKNSPWPGHMPIFCSQNRLSWQYCGAVFSTPPAWIEKRLGGGYRFWGPDISFFGGLFHLYYSATLPGTQHSIIALATSPTLDMGAPNYGWTDAGPVIASSPSTNFNAIDPDILQEPNNGPVHLTFGSFWTGIKQVEVSQTTGLVIRDTEVELAARPGVPTHAIEGASLSQHGAYYYLFVSIDFCCNNDQHTNDYKIAVGRSLSPKGPFLDRGGTPMLAGGATVILTGDNVHWAGVGGEQLFSDPVSGQDLLVYQAQDLQHGGMPNLRVRPVEWSFDSWPVVQ